MEYLTVLINGNDNGYLSVIIDDRNQISETSLEALKKILIIDDWGKQNYISNYNCSGKVRFNYYQESDFILRSAMSVLAKGNGKGLNELFDDYTFGQDYYIKNKSEDTLLPTIHVFSSNVCDSYLPLFPRYSTIMDSSIWNFFYSREEAIEEMAKQNKIINVLLFERLKYILHYYNERRYEMVIAREFADFNARMTCNSYMGSKYHGSYVSPFVFHSEKNTYKAMRNDNDLRHVVQDYKWDFLLVDDYSRKPLKDLKNDDILMNKCEIICSDISKVFPDAKIGYTDDFENIELFERTNAEHVERKADEEYNIVIHRVISLEEAKKVLDKQSGHKYDIILLDYLLGEGNDHNREYGYQLLESIKEKDSTIAKGPLGEQCIMFISAFTTAINERLLAESWTRNEKDYWYIGQGACPTNTIYLFLYYLLRLMKRRVDAVKPYVTLMETLHTIFEDNAKTRSRARDCFDEIFELKTLASKLFGEKGKSRFCTDIIKQHPTDEAFWEHLFHLIYLIAYGSVRQWEEMWEEYIFIQHSLDKLESLDQFDREKDQAKYVSALILKYIAELRDINR